MLTMTLIVTVPALAQGPVNLDFESGQLGMVPAGWYMSYPPPATTMFKAELVDEACVHGQRCARLTGPEVLPNASWFGNLAHKVPGERYRGKRVRFRAAVRAEGAGTRAQMWFAVDRTSAGYTLLDNMGNRPITSAQWGYYDIEVNLAPDTTALYIGFLLTGTGRVWADDGSLEIFGNVREDPPGPARPITDHGLENVSAFARLLSYVRHFHPCAAWTS
jgi:hypothetical protein